jgi:type IV pilus assembly protein PilV
MVNTRRPRAQQGATMIEILIAMLIIAFGLLGMGGLQGRMQLSEVEAYQRSQALLLVSDMASRISANRLNAASYVTAALGTSTDCSGLASTTRAQSDLKEWCTALQGAAEFSGASATTTTSRGAMVGGRGCVQVAADGDYLITIAWQGLTALSAPPAAVTCGADSYNDGVKCTNDQCRRVVTTIVRIASLT